MRSWPDKRNLGCAAKT